MRKPYTLLLLFILAGCSAEIDEFLQTRYHKKDPPPYSFSITLHGKIRYDVFQEIFSDDNTRDSIRDTYVRSLNLTGENISSLTTLMRIYASDSNRHSGNLVFQRIMTLAKTLSPNSYDTTLLGTAIQFQAKAGNFALDILELNGIKNQYSNFYDGHGIAYKDGDIESIEFVTGIINYRGEAVVEFEHPLSAMTVLKSIVVNDTLAIGNAVDSAGDNINEIIVSLKQNSNDALQSTFKFKDTADYDSLVVVLNPVAL